MERRLRVITLQRAIQKGPILSIINPYFGSSNNDYICLCICLYLYIYLSIFFERMCIYPLSCYTDRYLLSTNWLSTYLSTCYLPIYPLAIYLSTHLLSSYLSTCYLSVYPHLLSTYLFKYFSRDFLMVQINFT